MKRIKIEQAYYGEVSRAHSCISQTINDRELSSFLIAFTDRPAAMPPGVELAPYLSGTTFSKFYVFTKTFPDPYATRSGMVFTHVLIFNAADLPSINNLEEILSLYVEQVPIDRTKITSIDKELSAEIPNAEINQPLYIQQAISAYINGSSPILFSGSITAFKNIFQLIWSFSLGNLRSKIKFRASFSPSDIMGITDLTIVSIQKEFLSKWIGQTVISAANEQSVKITSNSETLFLGYKSGNPFYKFLNDLNIDSADVQKFKLCNDVFTDFETIEQIRDANKISQDIRILSKLSPLSEDGKAVKDMFLTKLQELSNNETTINIRAIRNIDWSAFLKGEDTAKKIVSKYVTDRSNDFSTELLVEILDIALNEEVKNWWHSSVKNSLTEVLAKNTTLNYQLVWKMIDFSAKSLVNIFTLIPINDKAELHLRETIPTNIKTDTVEEIKKVCKKRYWSLLYADMLLSQLSINDVLKETLSFENKLSYDDSIGVKYVLENLSTKEVICLALDNKNIKLIDACCDRLLVDASMLGSIDIKSDGWLKIWAAYLSKGGKITFGIDERATEIISSVFDLMISGQIIDEIIIDAIANSVFADISKYKQRAILWNSIPLRLTPKFIDATIKDVLTDFISGQILIDNIEELLSNAIFTKLNGKNSLQEYRDISIVVRVYTAFPKLNEDLLVNYISLYYGTLTEKQAKELGGIALNNKLNKVATAIYKKAKNNQSFKIASSVCESIATITSSWSWFSKPEKTYSVETSDKKVYEDTTNNQLPVVVILTAIKEEYLAVREHLSDIADVRNNGITYEGGIFNYNGQNIATVIIKECGAKNTAAAQETQRAITSFNPQMMLFVGIAGSRKPSDFKIGDVIFPSKIYSYEGGKATTGDFLSRPEAVEPTFDLFERAKAERLKPDWKVFIKGHYQNDYKADIGTIASGEQLIDHHNSEIGKVLTKHYNDSSAVEMESYGFISTTKRQTGEARNIIVGVVRGISDVIPHDGIAKVSNNNRPDNVKQLASDTAAAFAFWLIYKTYSE